MVGDDDPRPLLMVYRASLWHIHSLLEAFEVFSWTQSDFEANLTSPALDMHSMN